MGCAIRGNDDVMRGISKELVRTEGTELIYLQTDDLEVTIKGGTNSPALSLVSKEERDSSLVLTFYKGQTVNISKLAVAGTPVLQTESVHSR